MRRLFRLLPLAACLLAGTAAAQAQTSDARFRGVPRIGSEDSWSIRPRGRLQIDVGEVSAPGDSPLLGEVRRARLGVEGTLPRNLSYLFEVEFAEGIAEITDALVVWRPSDAIAFTAGHHKDFDSIEELTSDRFLSFLERAAFTDAFAFGRRVGVSAEWHRRDVLVQFGLFGDNLRELDEADDAFSLDGRVVYAPAVGDARLHVGLSGHWRDDGDRPRRGTTVRYSVRPLLHADDRRLVQTPRLLEEGNQRIGLELAVLRGPFHAVAEAQWLRIDTVAPDAEQVYSGGYAEIGWFLTGETRAYRSGRWDRTRVRRPIETGGFGAIQANLRVDRVDLDEGGRQDALVAGLIWIPTDYVRFLVNYAHLWLDDAALPTPDGRRDYEADMIGARAQIDF